MAVLLEVTEDLVNGVVVLAAQGEVDISTAQLLRDRLDGVPAEEPRLVIDLSAVTFIDSTGLGVLVATRRRLESENSASHVDLVITGQQILRVFEVTGLTAMFRIYSTLEEALAA